MPLKDRVLAVLEENKGKSVSGSDIAASIGMTRSAVWKAIKSLREEGYSIYAVTNRGYCLLDESDILSEPGIRSYLKTERLGRHCDIFKTIDSTNTFAKSLAQLGGEHGSIIIAEQQTAGRGRMSRSYYSPGNMGIYMSVILRPKMSVEYCLMITSCAAVAVAEAIENVCGVKADIKWVNDIYINGKKLCGILTESAIDIEHGGLEYAILGIGLNVTNDSFPKELENTATSLYLETGKIFSRNQLIAEILNRLEENLAAISDKSFLDEYRKRSILFGHRVAITKNEVTEYANCEGIDEYGRLVVTMEGTGECRELNSGDVKVADK
mgnify:FL=1